MLSDRPQIVGEEVAIDIRNGMSDAELILKYRLSARHLLSLFKKLVEAGLISEKELGDRVDLFSAERDVQLAEPCIEEELVPGLPSVKWKFKCDGWVFSSPTIVSELNSAFFGSWDGHLYSVDCGSGRLNWKFKTGDVVRS
ncbi:MAG: PQQ-like beta-propeller repeat protein, partial [Desulfomonile tiedjei]|nr:PQQ-like beta-propeller repeat protein [Desulfomonile tiedjei]